MATAARVPPTKVGPATVGVRGNWIVRCINPCTEFAADVARRAADAAEELTISGLTPDRVAELGPRLRASAARAAKLASAAEAELGALPTGDAGRLAIENRFQAAAALIESEVQAAERQLVIEGLRQGGIPKGWGKLVYENVYARLNTIWQRATQFGKQPIDPHLNSALEEWRAKASDLLKKAEEFEKLPEGAQRTQAELDLLGQQKELDKALEGIEREERVRSDVGQAGGTSFGESDQAIQERLRTRGGPDIARAIGDTLLLAESKGNEVGKAIEQLAKGMSSSIPELSSIVHYDLRIYLKPDVWEQLVKTGTVGGYVAKRRGDSWLLIGVPEVRGIPIKLFPG